MANDPRKLPPIELCRLLNSTPLGEVITEQQLRNHRTRAGRRIGDAKHVDLMRYVGWLAEQRHGRKPKPDVGPAIVDAHEAAAGAAGIANERRLKSHGQKLTTKQEALIAALLSEPTHSAAAIKAGVSPSTLYRWLQLPGFRAAFRRARQELVESAVGRMQAAAGQAIETLNHICRHGRRDSDKIRASIAILDRAIQGVVEADALHGEDMSPEAEALGTTDVVKALSGRLSQIDRSELSTLEKTRLTATLADALLRAIEVDVLDKRLEALHEILINRKEKQP